MTHGQNDSRERADNTSEQMKGEKPALSDGPYAVAVCVCPYACPHMRYIM